MLTLVTPPVPVITVPDAKAHLRVDHADDDLLIAGLLEAATSHVSETTGRAIGVQTWDLTLNAPWDVYHHNQLSASYWLATGAGRYGLTGLRLPKPPLRSVDSITYRDADGVNQTFAAGGYEVGGVGAEGTVHLLEGVSFPSVYAGPGAIKVRFTAGYDADTVPAGIRLAILLLVGHWYETRETVNIGNISGELPFTTSALLAPYRVFA